MCWCAGVLEGAVSRGGERNEHGCLQTAEQRGELRAAVVSVSRGRGQLRLVSPPAAQRRLPTREISLLKPVPRTFTRKREGA